MRIVVTGGAGFIMVMRCEKLVAAGHEVTIYDKMFRSSDCLIGASSCRVMFWIRLP